MSNGFGNKISHYQRPVELLEIAKRGQQTKVSGSADGESFKDMFSREIAGTKEIQFSRHAQERLHSRGIELKDAEVERLASGIDKADVKGSRETLIMMDDLAFVVSVKNRTVITAFDRDNLREGVVTSIDSAVII